MKQLFLGITAASLLAFTACNNASDKKAETNTTEAMDHSKMNHDSMPMDGNNPHDNTSMSSSQTATGINAVVDHYLHLKNVLAADNSKEAATAAKELGDAFKAVNKESLSTQGQKTFTDVSSTISEHAEHIADNGSDIKHQREHFQDLSNDVYDLVKAAGAPKTLYKDYCPMVKANWLSETKDIKNPYYGSKSDMATCGEVKETLNK